MGRRRRRGGRGRKHGDGSAAPQHRAPWVAVGPTVLWDGEHRGPAGGAPRHVGLPNMWGARVGQLCVYLNTNNKHQSRISQKIIHTYIHSPHSIVFHVFSTHSCSILQSRV